MTKKDWTLSLRVLTDIAYLFGYLLWIPIITALVTRELKHLFIFTMISFITLMTTGYIRKRMPQDQSGKLHITIGFALGTILLSVVSSIPFVLDNLTWQDSIFEVVSAWTGTGLTMLPYPQSLPYALAIFRVVIQWVSGLWFILFLILLRKDTSAGQDDSRDTQSQSVIDDLWSSGKVAILIYGIYSLVGFLFLWLTGVPPFEALTHTFTSISSGGFSTNDIGVGVYGIIPSLVALFLMIGGSLSINNHRMLLTGKLRSFSRSLEVKSLLRIILAGSALLFVVMMIKDEANNTPPFASMFYAVSALTTCGAGTVTQLSHQPYGYVFILLILMVIGGVFGYTIGIINLRTLMVYARDWVRKSFLSLFPGSINQTSHSGLLTNEDQVSNEQALLALGYVALYVIVALAGSLVFVFAGYSNIQALFTVFSAQGNVGLNIIPAELYYSLPGFLKLQLMIHMFMGRTILYPVVLFWRENKSQSFTRKVQRDNLGKPSVIGQDFQYS